MGRKRDAAPSPGLAALRDCIEAFNGRYELRRASDFGEYVLAKGTRADEEILTEPLLAMMLERVLGFPTGAYFPQLGKSGLKPDFTPKDLIAHSFVLDAKSSDESLGAHVGQIARYVEQRSLAHGVLFNLRELRVYPRGAREHDRSLSFGLLPLWQVATGQALPGPEVEAFDRFREVFRHREMSVPDKIGFVRKRPSWARRLAAGEPVEVDVDFLVDQLRRLADELARDAGLHADDLDQYLALGAGREERLTDELKQLALDLEPGVRVEQLPQAATAWRSSPGLPERVWRQFLLRVSYLALTRILLYRAWEDVQFVSEHLHDGGFGLEYDRMDESVRAVLRRAFSAGAERYRTLFAADNNYEWYRPGEPVLVDVLYRLAPVPLGRLDQDVLGALYVSYVDEIDRDRLGQFFTPRDVVRFMLDRVGFVGPDGVFNVEGNERKPLRVFDFATGSGGFLVEAARRIIDDSGIAGDDPSALQEALVAIARGFVGGEISPFPYYLTEINLLLQVSRLLGRLRVLDVEPPGFVLGVLRTDSLATKSSPAGSLGVDAALRADRGELPAHDIFDVLPVEDEKRGVYRELREDATFDLVVGNPPYVAEANNRPLFRHLKAIPAWKGVYRGKTDYLYYFLWLAVEKLKPGGRMCVITPAAWMNAGAADFLRERLATELRLDELFLFGSYRLFADEQGPAPTPIVESAILVATKAPAPKGHKLRVVALEDEVAAGNPGRRELLAEMARRAGGRAGRGRGIQVHSVAQGELRADRPWPVKHTKHDLPTRLADLLDDSLGDESSPVELLGHGWKPFMGIQTCADAYSKKIARRLSIEARRLLDQSGAAIGDPVCALPPGTEALSPWREHPDSLVRSPEPEAILYGAIDDRLFVSLVRLTGADQPAQAVLDELEPWKPLLRARAEIARNPRRRWWETCWPRDTRDLAAPKVIALHRTDRGRFALDERGDWSPSGRMCVVVGKNTDAPVAYLCGLLNSELLDLWYSIRGRTPRDVWRDYEPKPLRRMPYRRPEGDPRAAQIAELVRAIAANRRALLPHRAVVRDLTRIVKDPWKSGPVEIDRPALVRELPASETVSVRLDPALHATIAETPAGRARRESQTTLAFGRKARVEGDPVRLDLLEEIVGTRGIDDVRPVLLPRDLDAFASLARERRDAVTGLLAEGRRLVEEVERLVCALYGVPDDLADEVVAHAVRRAAG